MKYFLTIIKQSEKNSFYTKAITQNKYGIKNL